MSNKTKSLVKNSKAFFNYFLDEFLECGIELKGSEIKSLRKSGASMVDSYVVIKNYQAFLVNMYIAPYESGNIFNHETHRSRKLLMHKKEIIKYSQKAKEKSLVIIPTKIYLKNGMAKVEIALGKGKKLHDKRDVIKKRDDDRMIKTVKNTYGKFE